MILYYSMNRDNINRYYGNKILEWCIDTLGKSKYHVTYPNLIVYIKRTKDKCFENNKYILGYFDECENNIIIFAKNHKSFISFVGTIIHEYIHYKQNIAGMYYKLLNKSNYDEHPFEVEAREAENRYKKECLSYLKRNLR
jgi:hypothetical protein